ncbi:MAG: DUF4097 domain-containing protein [Melioribacteraceae bacterium]|nr:DUF4097 domain-containing protein [Melioribacteraceae bacterium]MCF8264772.1 DUF4097 domain-containing protein [Melioribacteraceae bacterium]MCF8413717.1 DUF4097 domain-containing protein [Melioribacteraceae bacterium]MCF8432209.1 DUF4097 domain-containing protein [Melioribacteraceae bacterium]
MFKKFILFLFIPAFFISIKVSAQHEREIQKSFNLSATGELQIDTYKGTIEIESWDKNEVSVYAKIEADDSDWIGGTSPERQLEEVRIDFDSSDDFLSIETEYKKNNSWNGSNTRALVHYKIKMPQSADLTIKDYKSESKINNLNSKIKFETYKGIVLMSGIDGSVDLETYKGDVEIIFTNLDDDCSFETYKGTIALRIPESAGFSIDAELSKKGDIRSDFDIEERGRHSRDDVRGVVNGGGHYIEFSTYKGELKLLKG